MANINNTSEYPLKAKPIFTDRVILIDSEKKDKVVSAKLENIGEASLGYDYKKLDTAQIEFIWSNTSPRNKTARDKFSSYIAGRYKLLNMFIKWGYDAIKTAPNNLEFYLLIDRYRSYSKKGVNSSNYFRKAGYRYSPVGYGGGALSNMKITGRDMVLDIHPDKLFSNNKFPHPSGDSKHYSMSGNISHGFIYLQFRIAVVDKNKITDNNFYTGIVHQTPPLRRLKVIGISDSRVSPTFNRISYKNI